MLTEFNAQTAKAFRDDVVSQLDKIGRKYGIEINAENLRMNSIKTLSFSVTASVGEVELEKTDAGRMFLSYAPVHGFKKTDLGRTFTYKGTLYKIIGWQPTARKYPVMVERAYDGATVRFMSSHALSLLGGA